MPQAFMCSTCSFRGWAAKKYYILFNKQSENKYLIYYQAGFFLEEFPPQCNLKHIGKDVTYILYIYGSAALIAYDHDRVFFSKVQRDSYIFL